MYELCNPEFFFDKLHLTPPDNKLGRADWKLDNTSGCTSSTIPRYFLYTIAQTYSSKIKNYSRFGMKSKLSYFYFPLFFISLQDKVLI